MVGEQETTRAERDFVAASHAEERAAEDASMPGVAAEHSWRKDGADAGARLGTWWQAVRQSRNMQHIGRWWQAVYHSRVVRRIAQAALLAGVVRAPSAYDPFCAPLLARERQQTVLAQMYADGMITAAQQQTARAESLAVWQPNVSHQSDAYCAA